MTNVGVAARDRVLRVVVALTAAFLSKHGCFPIDRTNAREIQWNEAMHDAYELLGGQEAAIKTLAAYDAGREDGE